MKKALLSALALLPIAFGAAPEAKAANICFDYMGQNICAQYGSTDFIQTAGWMGNESFRIQCRNSVASWWRSYGTMSQAEKHSFVNNYCATRGTSY